MTTKTSTLKSTQIILSSANPDPSKQLPTSSVKTFTSPKAARKFLRKQGLSIRSGVQTLSDDKTILQILLTVDDRFINGTPAEPKPAPAPAADPKPEKEPATKKATTKKAPAEKPAKEPRHPAIRKTAPVADDRPLGQDQ